MVYCFLSALFKYVILLFLTSIVSAKKLAVDLQWWVIFPWGFHVFHIIFDFQHFLLWRMPTCGSLFLYLSCEFIELLRCVDSHIKKTETFAAIIFSVVFPCLSLSCLPVFHYTCISTLTCLPYFSEALSFLFTLLFLCSSDSILSIISTYLFSSLVIFSSASILNFSYCIFQFQTFNFIIKIISIPLLIPSFWCYTATILYFLFLILISYFLNIFIMAKFKSFTVKLDIWLLSLEVLFFFLNLFSPNI